MRLSSLIIPVVVLLLMFVSIISCKDSNEKNLRNSTQVQNRDYHPLNSSHELIVSRSFAKKFKLFKFNVKRSLKKVFHAWAYFTPEIGLCQCLANYAWFTYPIVSETTYKLLGRSKEFTGMFIGDFINGFQHHFSKTHRSDTEDDFKYNSNRRDDESQAQTSQQNFYDAGLFKSYLESQTKRPINENGVDESKLQIALNALKLVDATFSDVSESAANDSGNEAVSGRKMSGADLSYSQLLHLPPPNYSYFKDGTYYHIHDLRKNHHGDSTPSWFKNFNFENAILGMLGLPQPGRTFKPTFAVCSKKYLFSALLRFVAHKFV